MGNRCGSIGDEKNECALVSWGGMKMSIPSQQAIGWANKRA